MRPTRSGLLGAFASCHECDWTAGSKNALGLAAQHHDRTGHTITTEQTIGVRYGALPGDSKPGETPATVEGQEAML